MTLSSTTRRAPAEPADAEALTGALEGERFFRGDASSAWRHLFAWLGGRDGIRDDRARVITPDAFVVAGDGLGVRLDLRRAEREVAAVCDVDAVALRQLAALLDLKWPLVQTVAARSVRALVALVADSWPTRIGEAPLRWRVVGSTVRAVLTPEYVPLDDIALLRVLERPLTVAGLAPVRAMRMPTETRIEFGVTGADRPRSNRPGVILRNSETGHAAVALYPALVRNNGVATRLTEPCVEHRHVIADRDAFAERLVASVPALLAAATAACERWSAIRNRPCSPEQTARALAAVERSLGKRIAESVQATFAARSPEERTASGLYAVVAAATRDLPPRKRTDVDPLLSELLAAAVVPGVSAVHASTL